MLLMLLFAVPFWGLQYKLSLYHSVTEKQAMPAAKLLSQKERPAANIHLERLSSSEEPASTTRLSLSSGAWSALLVCAVVLFSTSSIRVLATEETPRVLAPAVSRFGPRPPPIVA